MVKLKIDDIVDGFNVGNFSLWDSAVADIEERGYVLLKSLMGEELICKSEESLKKYLNIR